MNQENDLTLRNLFTQNRKYLAWDDENQYKWKYKETQFDLSLKPRFRIMFKNAEVDETRSHLFSVPGKFLDLVDEDPYVKLHKFLGEHSRHVRGLVERVTKIYEDAYGPPADCCDCCGRKIHFLNRVIPTFGGLCEICNTHFDNRLDQEKILEVF